MWSAFVFIVSYFVLFSFLFILLWFYLVQSFTSSCEKILLYVTHIYVGYCLAIASFGTIRPYHLLTHFDTYEFKFVFADSCISIVVSINIVANFITIVFLSILSHFYQPCLCIDILANFINIVFVFDFSADLFPVPRVYYVRDLYSVCTSLHVPSRNVSMPFWTILHSDTICLY